MRVVITIPRDAQMTTGPLLATSVDDDRLLEVLLGRDAKFATELRSEGHTDRGWRFTSIRATAGGEHRIAAMYYFGEWRGYVLVRFADVSLVPLIEAALCAATPDWRGDGEVHCIAELYA
jgi:hypothetical protein